MPHSNIRLPFLLFFLIFIQYQLHAQNRGDFLSTGNSKEEIIGKNWIVLDEKSTDFDHDKRIDLILALEYIGSDPTRLGERQILILTRSEKGFEKNFSSKSALLGKEEGGIFGDPFSEIKIKKDTFILSHYGGSAWRWGVDVQFRLQKNHWVMIGKKNFSYFNGIHCEKLKDFSSSKITDINFLTGERYDKEITEADGWSHEAI